MGSMSMILLTSDHYGPCGIDKMVVTTGDRSIHEVQAQNSCFYYYYFWVIFFFHKRKIHKLISGRYRPFKCKYLPIYISSCGNMNANKVVRMVPRGLNSAENTGPLSETHQAWPKNNTVAPTPFSNPIIDRTSTYIC